MASQSGVGARGETKDLNWTKNLRPLPKFTTEQIHNHVEGCGKNDIGSKGYKFFTESYIHDVYVGYDEGTGHATIRLCAFEVSEKTRSLTNCLLNVEGVKTEMQKYWKPLAPVRPGR